MEDKKDFVLGDARKFGKDQVELALADMQEYFAGKATVDQKATANEAPYAYIVREQIRQTIVFE